MAAGLAGMVARLSTAKDYGLPAQECERAAGELDDLGAALREGAVADAEAYGGIKAAYQIPREDKQRRSEAIQAAAVRAAEVPLANGAACRRVHDLGRQLLGHSNPNAGSDLAVGIALARVGVAGCVANVRANLGLIKAEDLKQDFERKIATLELEGEATC
jgi:formiminotetrahydrofolate cyclodeaminase